MRTDTITIVEFDDSEEIVRGVPQYLAGHANDGIPLMDIGRGQCRFPVCEDRSVPGGHLFCAQATSADAVYCAHHHRIATAVEARRSGSAFVPRKRAA